MRDYCPALRYFGLGYNASDPGNYKIHASPEGAPYLVGEYSLSGWASPVKVLKGRYKRPGSRYSLGKSYRACDICAPCACSFVIRCLFYGHYMPKLR